MLRHTVLCLVLAFQCTTALNFTRLGNRIENRHYNQTVEVAHRDDWFWDDHFWRYPHMMRMECPDGYGWEGDYKTGECKMCMPGQYSASWGPTVRCTDCPPRYYQPNAGSNKCMRCPEWSPMSASGSKSPQDCEELMDNKMMKTTSSTFKAEIEVAGDYTWMNDVLNEMSGYPAHMMSANWKYDAEKDCSMGTVSFSMARRAAFEAHMYVQELKTMIPLVNDWIKTGHAYVNRIFSMLNVADSFYLLGLNMDPTEIHRRMRNVKVMKVDSHYMENCEADAMPYKADSKSKPNMMFCEMDASYNNAESSQVYLSYTAECDACKTLGGVNKMRNFIRDMKMDGCGEAESCRKSMMWCEYNMEKKESWFVVYVSKRYAKKLDEAFFENYKMMKDDMDVEWKMNKFFTAEDCPGGPKESTTTECPDKCGEFQEVCWQSGMCRGCPFGSFFDDESERCQHCDYREWHMNRKTEFLISETYWPNAASFKECMKYHGDYTVIDDHELTQKHYYLDRRPFDIPRDNRQRYKMDLEGKLDVCYAIQIKDDFGKFCNDKFPNLKDHSFDDFTDFDLTKLSCLIMDRVTELYKSNCDGRDYKWPSTDDFYWVDAVCMAVRHVTKTEMNMKEKSIKCEEVDESIRHITMPFRLQRGFSNDLDWGSILIPLFQPVSQMMRADFSTASKAMRAAMEHFGMYKTSELTGLKMTNYVRDLILNVPRNMKMSKGSWEMMNKKEDVFCENGFVKRECRSACAMSYNQCIQKPGDNFELTCTADECNDCAVTYKYKEGEEEKTYECVDICKEMMDPNDGFAALVMGNPDKDATSKIYRMACNKGFRVQATEEELKKCNEEKPKDYTCNAEGNPNEAFQCMDDKCDVMPDNLENGFVKAYRNNPELSCRYVEMACDPGYVMKGENMRFCDGEGNWMGEMPTCEPAKCKDDVKETVIENGMFINELVGTSMSWYRCNVNNPTYKGENDYFAADQCGENIVCGRHENDHCPPMIENGYKVREWKQMSKEKEMREKEIWNAQYRCAPKYAIKDHEMFKEDEKKHGWSQCSDGEENKLPTCVRVDDGSDDDDRKPCKMPEVIYNGELVEEFKNDKGEVTHGKYRCNEGFMMVETMKKDHGFCRDWDRSYELPYCVKPEEWYKLEFELVNGYGKMENAGRVKARHHYADGTMGEWYSACDDHFNSPAAGSVCRTLGYNYGKMIEAPKKRMRPIKHVPFGITNFWCYYDDVLPQSHNCHSEDYGQMGYPLCMPEEQIAVSCFDVWWNVDVKFRMKSKNKHKMFCPVEIEKEGVKMKTKKMGLHVKWGGLKMNTETGNYDYTEFVEGTHYESKKFRKRKGFRAIYIGDINQYDCFYCNVHLGDHWLNPSDPDSEEAARATNHNCGHKDQN